MLDCLAMKCRVSAAYGGGGYLPVHSAAAYNKWQVLELLRDKHKADLTAPAKGKEGLRPIHVAAGEGHTDAVRVLLASGARVTDLDENRLQPCDGAVAMLRYLVTQGAATPRREVPV